MIESYMLPLTSIYKLACFIMTSCDNLKLFRKYIYPPRNPERRCLDSLIAKIQLTPSFSSIQSLRLTLLRKMS